VLGAPLPGLDGTLSLGGVAGRMLETMRDHPILMVRYLTANRPDARDAAPFSRTPIVKEIIT
jgi:hypothetical protein